MCFDHIHSLPPYLSLGIYIYPRNIYIPLDFMSSLLLILLLIPWVQLVWITCAQVQSHPLEHGQPTSNQILKENCFLPSRWLIIITTLILRVRPQEHLTHPRWDITWWSYAVNPSYCELIFKTAMSRREHFKALLTFPLLPSFLPWESPMFPFFILMHEAAYCFDLRSTSLLVSFSMLLYFTNRARGTWLLNHRTFLLKNKKERSVGKACLLCNQEEVPCSLQTLIYL